MSLAQKTRFERKYGIPAVGIPFLKYCEWENGQHKLSNFTKEEKRLSGKFLTPKDRPNYFELRRQEKTEEVQRIMVRIREYDLSIFEAPNTSPLRFQRADIIREIMDDMEAKCKPMADAINIILGQNRFNASSIAWIYKWTGRKGYPNKK